MEKTLKINAQRFRNAENGYTVAYAEDEGKSLCVVGVLPENSPGRTFVLRGSMKRHPTYGEQFAITSFEELMPTEKGDIEDFLASGVISGIGTATAKMLVYIFGDRTLEVLAGDPEVLTKVPGIGKSRAKMISESYREHSEFVKLAMELREYDISSELALKLYKKYGVMAMEEIRMNPYAALGAFRGIGFKRADEIAKKLGIDNDNEYRIESAIGYVMGRSIQEGHSYYPKERLVAETAELLEIRRQDVEERLLALAYEGKYRIDEIDGAAAVYNTLYYNAERNVAWRLKLLDESELKPLSHELASLIAESESFGGKKLSESQRAAVEKSLLSGVTVITGGPGTGKTTIINTLIDVLRYSGHKVAIAAPTGRAAKRIYETSGNEASTIHRLLEYAYSEDEEEQYFERNAENPLEEDAIIIDEASMVDLLLMNALLDAVKPGTRLILVGDADQLPPVGAGSVLRDILASDTLGASRLSEIFRQAQESLIVVNAHRINAGEYPKINSADSDFFFIECGSDSEIADTVRELCERRLPTYLSDESGAKADPLRDIQVLTPTKRGELGTHSLNVLLREALNPPEKGKKERKQGDLIFREGDKVMQIKNNYSLKWRRQSDFSEGEGVFNGDVGFIESIDSSANTLTVVYDDDRRCTYDFTQLDELEPAFAMTVHKSQGSEFNAVVIPMARFSPMLATRNLLYTAVTRGKMLVVLAGYTGSLRRMVDNDTTQQRYSALSERLGKLYGEIFDDTGASLPF